MNCRHKKHRKRKLPDEGNEDGSKSTNADVSEHGKSCFLWLDFFRMEWNKGWIIGHRACTWPYTVCWTAFMIECLKQAKKCNKTSAWSHQWFKWSGHHITTKLATLAQHLYMCKNNFQKKKHWLYWSVSGRFFKSTGKFPSEMARINILQACEEIKDLEWNMSWVLQVYPVLHNNIVIMPVVYMYMCCIQQCIDDSTHTHFDFVYLLHSGSLESHLNKHCTSCFPRNHSPLECFKILFAAAVEYMLVTKLESCKILQLSHDMIWNWFWCNLHHKLKCFTHAEFSNNKVET